MASSLPTKVISVDTAKAGIYVALGFLLYRLAVKPMIDKVIP